jgi:hypothetical protein
MTITEQKTDTQITEAYIKANFPDIIDVRTCAEYVLKHEDKAFIDDLCSFYERNQHQW